MAQLIFERLSEAISHPFNTLSLWLFEGLFLPRATREQHWALSGSLQVLEDGRSATLVGDVLNRRNLFTDL